MEDYQLHPTMVFSLSYWRFVRLLTGKGDRTVEGDNLDVTGLYEGMKDIPKIEMMFFTDFVFEAGAKILLGTYGSNLDKEERDMKFMMENFNCAGTHFTTPYRYMVIALGCAILRKRTGDHKYSRFKNKMIQELEKYYEKKAPIATGPYLLVAAEAMAHRPRRNSWEDIQRAYLEAMEESRRCGGFIYVEAYGYEKLAKLAKARKDGPKVQFYLEQALATYTRWGATVKIDELAGRLAVRR